MKITASGTEVDVPADSTVEEILSILGEKARYDMAVEVNRAFVHTRDYSTTTIREGDEIEMIYMASGG
jgi:thiamine biosynthesis protein ThiS